MIYDFSITVPIQKQQHCGTISRRSGFSGRLWNNVIKKYFKLGVNYKFILQYLIPLLSKVTKYISPEEKNEIPLEEMLNFYKVGTTFDTY